MIAYTAKRVASAVFLVFVVSLLSFFLTRLVPGDPARTILGVSAPAQQVAEKRTELGLDENVFVAYAQWLGHAVTGSLGSSWFTGQDVASSIASRLPVTLSIALVATVVAGVIGTALGLLAAVRRGFVDRLLQPISIGGFAIPNFIVAIVLLGVFAIHLRALPATGYTDLTVDPAGWARSITLPVVALAVGAIAAVAQQMRNAAIFVLQQDYVRSLRGRGLRGSTLYLKHVLRNSAPVALTVLSLQFIGLLSGAVIIENVFALPGIAALTVSASTQRDEPVIQGAVVTVVVVVVLVNLLIDLAYAWLNPKVRTS
ncbi:ABC transporter permease [Acrocarpospora pleiomorpha]|uniref:ABC transporter permease n=1 Tax=Acrocarpospora pleiomorpha TaxID=90975 RepID=A0A5M3XPB1_9ACTN|nr:ABC transporter permease [Acrocarpospora pleiomorpha]GES22576.1 ABC transporter permease [Acrocarpospora pleiomorpha]